MDFGAHNEKLEFRPWLPGNLPVTRTISPRASGFALKLDDKTAVSRRIRVVLRLRAE